VSNSLTASELHQRTHIGWQLRLLHSQHAQSAFNTLSARLSYIQRHVFRTSSPVSTLTARSSTPKRSIPPTSLTMDRYRATSLFQPSNLNAALGITKNEPHQEIEPPQHLFGTVLGIPHTQMARLVGVLGFDFVFVDTLHV
jgi:hypothetical protein